MDLTALNGLGPARSEKLSAAGIEDIDQLADADPRELGERVDIPGATLEDFVGQARGIQQLAAIAGLSEDDLAQLVEAGVGSPEQLTGEDAADVAAAAGLDTERVADWQQAAEGPDVRDSVEETLDEMEPDQPAIVDSAERIQEGTLEASEDLVQRLGEARVVLEEGITDARVKFEDEVLAEARILPLKAREDAEEFLEDVQGNVVVLREAADDALVRVEGQIRGGLPVFKQTLDEAREEAEDGAREVRVKVEEIRDEQLIPKAESLKAKAKDLLDLE